MYKNHANKSSEKNILCSFISIRQSIFVDVLLQKINFILYLEQTIVMKAGLYLTIFDLNSILEVVNFLSNLYSLILF